MTSESYMYRPEIPDGMYANNNCDNCYGRGWVKIVVETNTDRDCFRLCGCLREK